MPERSPSYRSLEQTKESSAVSDLTPSELESFIHDSYNILLEEGMSIYKEYGWPELTDFISLLPFDPVQIILLKAALHQEGQSNPLLGRNVFKKDVLNRLAEQDIYAGMIMEGS